MYVVEGLLLLVGEGLLEEPSPSCSPGAVEFVRVIEKMHEMAENVNSTVSRIGGSLLYSTTRYQVTGAW